MPVAPIHATKYTCEKCGWSVVTKHRSDAILQPNKCGHCGSDKLIRTQAGFLEDILASTLSVFRK